jgi:hypothetical protein
VECDREAAPHSEMRLQLFNLVSDFFLGFTQFFLQPADQFIVLTFRKNEIIVGEIAIALFQFAFDFVPGTFEL